MLPRVGGPTNIEPPPDSGDDNDPDEGWEFEDLQSKYNIPLHDWATKSPQAALIRFEAMSSLVQSVRPKANAMIWPLGHYQGSERRHLMKQRQGQAVVYATWRVELFNQEWDTMMMAVKPLLAKSDMYKIFGEQGREGSASLVFKGDVADFVVYGTLKHIRDHLTGLGTFTAGNPYVNKLFTVAEKALGRDKMDTYLKRKIAATIKWPHFQDIKLQPQRELEGKTEPSNQGINIILTRQYTFAI